MECPHCKADFESKKNTAYCPFCGEDLRSAKDKAKDTSSFDYTWGMMHEDSLKKSKGPVDLKIRDEALNCYIKAVRENPAYALSVSRFLQQYPQPSDWLENQAAQAAQSWMPWQDLPAAQKLSCSLLFQAFKAGNVQSALRLSDLLSRYLQDGSTALSHEKIEDTAGRLFLISESLPDPDQKILQAAACRLTGKQQDAARLMNEAFAPEGIIVKDWPTFSAYTGTEGTLEKRLHQIDEGIRQAKVGNLDLLLRSLYRPLNQENLFEHLPLVMDQVLPIFEEYEEDWTAKTKEFLEQDILLRGIHLVLQQIKNSIAENDNLKDLLHLHYVHVYMESYEWITSTDFKLI